MTKLRDYFDEMVVYKDLRNNSFFSSLGLPAFLRDYLLKTFSDEYGNFDMQQVSAFVKKYSDKYQAIGSHRVDRIAACPCILDESAVPQPVGFDVSKYIKTTFRMYNAPRAEVELLCDNSVMDAIIDRFGPDVQTYAGDLQNFRVIEEIAVGKVFFNWIFGFEGKVRIKGPESVKKQYREMVMSAMNLV